MTQLGNERIVGVDVSKDRLDLYDWDSKCLDSIANDIDAIDRWLDGFSLPVRFAIEPTNQFHIALAERAHVRGHAVYLVDPHRLSHYRCGVGQRVKADPQDAQQRGRCAVGAVQNADQEDGAGAAVGGEKTRMGKGSGPLPGDTRYRPAQRAGANRDLPSGHLPQCRCLYSLHGHGCPSPSVRTLEREEQVDQKG